MYPGEETESEHGGMLMPTKGVGFAEYFVGFEQYAGAVLGIEFRVL